MYNYNLSSCYKTISSVNLSFYVYFNEFITINTILKNNLSTCSKNKKINTLSINQNLIIFIWPKLVKISNKLMD